MENKKFTSKNKNYDIITHLLFEEDFEKSKKFMVENLLKNENESK